MATKDYVGRVEDRVRSRIDAGLERVFRNVREKYSRPIFSEKVPQEIQDQEFDLMRGSPEIMAQFLQDQKASPESAVEYFESMVKRRGTTDAAPS